MEGLRRRPLPLLHPCPGRRCRWSSADGIAFCCAKEDRRRHPQLPPAARHGCRATYDATSVAATVRWRTALPPPTATAHYHCSIPALAAVCRRHWSHHPLSLLHPHPSSWRRRALDRPMGSIIVPPQLAGAAADTAGTTDISILWSGCRARSWTQLASLRSDWYVETESICRIDHVSEMCRHAGLVLPKIEIYSI